LNSQEHFPSNNSGGHSNRFPAEFRRSIGFLGAFLCERLLDPPASSAALFK
jgi:hypothetical protein